MTFEDVWNKIKAVRLSSILGFYGNVIIATFLIAVFSIALAAAGLLVLKIFIIIPWPWLLCVFVVSSGFFCMKKWGWGKQQ